MTYTYNNNGLITKQSVQRYTLPGSTSSSIVTNQYSYDDKGNLLSRILPNGQSVIYTYSPDYNLLLTKTHRQDASTTIIESNTLTADKKSVATSVVTSNGTTMSKSEYTYDSKGRVTATKVYSDAIHYAQQEFSYSEKSAQPTERKVLNVKAADGSLTPGSPGNPDGVIVEKSTYNDRGLQTSLTDGNGNVTTIAYDDAGRIKTVTHPDGAYASYTYSLTPQNGFNSVIYQDEGGNQYLYKYDLFGRLVEVFDTTINKALINKTYDGLSNLCLEVKRSLAGADQRTYYHHDLEGRLLETGILNIDNSRTPLESFTYKDGTNQVVHTVYGQTDAPTTTTTTTMDSMGYVTREDHTLGSSIYTDTYINDYLGNCTQYKSAYTASIGGAFTTRTAYDYAGRTVKVTDALNQTTAYSYDWQGNQISVTDPKGTVATNDYDAMGRLIQTTQPIDASSAGMSRYSYDPNGNITSIQVKLSADPERWSRVEYNYNSRNMLTQTASHADDSVVYYTQYYYDVMGNSLRMYTGLTTPLIISGLDQISGGSESYSTTKYTYDRFGNPLTMTDALGKTETNTYDLTGNVLTKTDRNGSASSYIYDVRGRLLNRSTVPISGKALNTTYTYALNGKTLSVSDGTTTTGFVYDAWGRLIRETTGTTVKTYSYNSGGLRTSFALTQDGTSRLSNSYTYDALGRLTNVIGSGATASYTYDANGNQSKVTYGNGVEEVFTYNKANLVTQVRNSKGSAVLSQYDYTYDLAGQQLSKSDHTGKVTNYTYDDLGQLLSESQVKNSIALSQLGYQYDASFNRSSKTENSSSLDYQYDLNNRLTSTNGGEVNSFTYADNGTLLSWNRTELILPDSTVLPAVSCDYSYDAENKLTSVTGTNSTTYAYAPNGLRTGKTVDGITTSYVWDGSQLVYESTDTAYIRGLTLIASNSVGELRYYLYNAHGDVVQLTDSQGNVVKEYDYDAFGREVNPDNNDANPFRYCGEYFDQETGFYYLRARYYSPVLGRFTQEDTYTGDPVDSLSLNLYIYCGNSPILFCDSTGHILEGVQELGKNAWNGVKGGIRWVLHKGEWVLSDKLGVDTATAGAAALNMIEDPNTKGVYHARFDCWQENVGYNHIYDFFFDLGTSMETDQFTFTMSGQNYVLWVWKGDYINLGAGAELGIYKQVSVSGYELPQWTVDKSLALTMTMNLKDNNGNTLIDYAPADRQWWITGFNSNYKNVQASDLTATFTVEFSQAMYDVFYANYGPNKTTSKWTFAPNTRKATLKF